MRDGRDVSNGPATFNKSLGATEMRRQTKVQHNTCNGTSECGKEQLVNALLTGCGSTNVARSNMRRKEEKEERN